MITLNLDILEDTLPPGICADIGTACDIPGQVPVFWRAALDRLQTHPRFVSPELNPDLVRRGLCGEQVEIDVYLCSRRSLDAILGYPGALGVHLLTTPDTDIFEDRSSSAARHRVLVCSDRDEFLALTADLAAGDADPQKHLPEYLASYLATVFHEIAHALIFIENSAMLVPGAIEVLSNNGQIDHDCFDCSTCYGIRPLTIDGQEVWAENLDQAVAMMETHTEELAFHLMGFALDGSSSPFLFPAAMGATEEIDRIVAQNASRAAPD